MRFSKFLVAMPVALSLFACSSDDSSTGASDPVPESSSAQISTDLNNPVDPNNPSAGNQGQTTGGDPTNNTGTQTQTTDPVASTVSLPAGASVDYLPAMYQKWKARWIISLNEEIAGGSSLDYDLFQGSRAKELLTQKMGAFYANPLRVIWDGGTGENCELTNMTSWNSVSFTVALRRKLGCTVSEGIGYGMLISLFNNDKDVFDGLWAYNIIARDNNNNGLMPWQLQSFSNAVSTAAALDADLDVATALILASKKWNDQRYLTDASELISAISKKGINMENLLIRPGDTWSNKDAYNLSYFSPVALRLFAAVNPVVDWNAVLNANYTYMKNIQAAGAVPLFPDWSNAAGQPTDPKNGSAKNSYMLFDKESVRIAWRIAWDMFWYADPNAQQILTGMANFISTAVSNNPAAIPTTSYNYSTGELSTSNAKGEHFIGSYCLMGMGVNQPWLDACFASFNNSAVNYNGVGYTGTYFKEILMMMYATFMNGGFTKLL